MAFRYRAFGLVVDSEIPWPGCPPAERAGGPDLVLRRSRIAAPRGEEIWSATIDGRPVTLTRREDGRHVLTHGDRARFEISAGAASLTVDAPGEQESLWQRFMLDTALFSASHLAGHELLHGTGLAHEGGVLAILAGSGAGKTSLALALLARGAALVADDVLAIDRAGGAMVVHPGPPVMNVPRSAAAGLEGERLADVGDEVWMSVRRFAREPLPMRALVLLRRDGDGPARAEPLALTPLDLLPHGVGFVATRERERERFELLADVAATVPAMTLTAAPSVPAAELADELLRAVRTPAVATP